MLILVLVVVGALAFDFTNGFHDTANAVATSIATGAQKPRVAGLMSAGVNFVGAFISISVAATIAKGIVTGAGLGRRLASVHWEVVGQMVTAWVFTIPAAALLAAAAWEISDLFDSSAAGSVVIALIAAAGAVVLFQLAQRTRVTPGELDRTTVTPETTAAPLPPTAPANA